jgi:hypothetical protein
LRGFIAILLTVALVVALVIVVDKLFLRRGSRIGKMEPHVSNANEFVEDIAQARLKRYPRLEKPELKADKTMERGIDDGSEKGGGVTTRTNEKENEWCDDKLLVEINTLSYCLELSRMRISCTIGLLRQ